MIGSDKARIAKLRQLADFGDSLPAQNSCSFQGQFEREAAGAFDMKMGGKLENQSSELFAIERNQRRPAHSHDGLSASNTAHGKCHSERFGQSSEGSRPSPRSSKARHRMFSSPAAVAISARFAAIISGRKGSLLRTIS